MDANDIRSLIPEAQYDPSEIVLIGSHMHPSPNVSVDVGSDGKKTVVISDGNAADLSKGTMRVRSDFVDELSLVASGPGGADVSKTPTMALVYAYGYEGHTYRLTKPRIMVVCGHGEPYKATNDEEAAQSLTGQLYMWRHSKHDQTVSIEVESGNLEKLVLEANQPGNRNVSAYSAHMQMAHRGGKIS